MDNFLDRFSPYKNVPLRRIEAARRIANVIYQLGSSHLFLSEEMALSGDEELRDMVEDCLNSLNEGYPWPPYVNVPYIILDIPEMKYQSLLEAYSRLYKSFIIYFLCSHISENSHFACMVAEFSNAKYRCLSIPVEQWHEYKKLPEYKGD